MIDKNGKPIRQGDIYWINFDPSVGSEIKKKRPAVVIQDHTVASPSETIVICPLTSSKNCHPFDVAIDEAFLEKKSRVRVIQPTSFDVQRFSNFKGRMSYQNWKKVSEKLSLLLGIE